jgi:hypothetical protein
MDVHLALYLLFFISETVRSTDMVAPLVDAVVASDAPLYPHCSVSLQFLDLCDRFAKFVKRGGKHL